MRTDRVDTLTSKSRPDSVSKIQAIYKKADRIQAIGQSYAAKRCLQIRCIVPSRSSRAKNRIYKLL